MRPGAPAQAGASSPPMRQTLHACLRQVLHGRPWAALAPCLQDGAPILLRPVGPRQHRGRSKGRYFYLQALPPLLLLLLLPQLLSMLLLYRQSTTG